MQRIRINETPDDQVERLRGGLSIDPNDLNTCLIEQADRFWHVAEAHARVTGLRDQAKFELEKLSAEIGNAYRAEALARDLKLTEGALETKVRLHPDVQEATQHFLDLKTRVDVLGALRESYIQRSYMLKELVTREQRQLTMLSMEHGDAARRSDLLDAMSARATQLRREGRKRA